jgi:iron complex outermembrane receptor protein
MAGSNHQRRLLFVAVVSLLLLQGIAQAVSAKALEEVIVTAQKREQSLQDVSLPVTAISFDRIETDQVISLEDLQYLVPALSFGNSLGFAKLFMRGIGLNDQTSGDEPSVAFHVDGAVVNDPKAQFTSLFDVKRVEVLRGPQGILYGRNATGGSINVITRKPTRDFEGYINASYGNYNRKLVEGAVSGPINSWISARAAYRGYFHDGYSKNETTGHQVENANRQAGRVELKFDFTSDVNLLLTGEYYMEDDQDLGLHYRRETFPQYLDPTQITQAQAAFATDPSLVDAAKKALAPLGLASCCSPPVAGGYPVKKRDYASEFDPQNDKTTWSFTSIWNIGLNDHFSVRNITNYRQVSGFFSQDFDMSGNISRYDTNGSAPTIHTRTDYTDQFSNEFQIHYEGPRMHALLALYNFKEHEKSINRSGASPYPVGLVPGLHHQRVFLTGYEDVVSSSVFGNLTYDITPQWSLKAGARWTVETHTVNTVNYIEVFLNPPFTPNPLSTIPHFQLPLIPGVTTLSDSKSTKDWSPMAGLEWRPTSNMLVYYTYSEGFKSATGQIGTTASGIAKPEKIRNHEIGIKSAWLDRSLTLNVDAFHYNFNNLQLARTVPAGGGGSGFVNLFENAAKTTGNGVEAEMYWQATDRLKVSGAVSWLDVKFDKFSSVSNFDPCSILVSVTSALVPNGICTPQVQSFKGNTTRNTPEWAFNFHGNYDYPLPNGALLSLGGDVSYKGKQYFSETNNNVESSKAYTLLDATLTYTAPSDKWHVTLWGKNLTNELVAAGSFAVSLSRTVGTTFLPPRTYGVTAGYSF